MIEIDTTLRDGLIVIRHSGTVTDREFADLARTIGVSTSDRSLSLCFDWRGIQYWTFASPETDSLAAWRNAARTIVCAAIIHGHRLNRQAAWLAAVLREEGAVVRSWRPQQAAMAAPWLRVCPRPHSSPRFPS